MEVTTALTALLLCAYLQHSMAQPSDDEEEAGTCRANNTGRERPGGEEQGACGGGPHLPPELGLPAIEGLFTAEEWGSFHMKTEEEIKAMNGGTPNVNDNDMCCETDTKTKKVTGWWPKPPAQPECIMYQYVNGDGDTVYQYATFGTCMDAGSECLQPAGGKCRQMQGRQTFLCCVPDGDKFTCSFWQFNIDSYCSCQAN